MLEARAVSMRSWGRLARWAFVAIASLIAPAHANASTVNWSAAGDRALVLIGGTAGVPQGNLVRLGRFNITDAQIAANSTNLSFLNTNFLEYASGSIGDGTDVDGTFTRVSINTSTNFSGQGIYIWVLNATNVLGATQLGVFNAPANSGWTFPPQTGTPPAASVDVGDSGVTAVIGSFGGPITVGGYLRSSTAILTAVNPGSLSSGTGVVQYAALKGQAFTQTGSDPPVVLTNSAFEFLSFVDAVSSGAVAGAAVQDPNAAVHTLSNVLAGLRFQFSAAFTNKALLDAAFSDATYRFSINIISNTLTPSVTLTNDDYPNAPHVANAGAAMAIDAGADFTLAWDAFTSGTVTDLIELAINNTGGSNVFATASDFLNPSRLTGTNTSAVIPANTLDPLQTYHAELTFVKLTSLDTNTISRAAGVGGFFTATDFSLATETNALTAGTLQFSSGAYGVNEDGDLATITVVRTSGSTGAVSVHFATSNGSATSPSDFIATNGTLTFLTGQTSATFTVRIIDDAAFELAESLNLTLSAPGGKATLGDTSNATLTIFTSDESSGSAQLDFLQSELDDVMECLAVVSLTFLAGDRDGAAIQITHCIDLAEQLLDDAQADGTVDALGAKGAKRLQKKFAQLLKRLNSTLDTLENPKRNDAKAFKALISVSAFAQKTQKQFTRFKKEAPLVVLEELKGKGGFHEPDETVCYRIHIFDLAKGAGCGPGTITITNLPQSVSLNIVNDGTIIKGATDFCVVTGTNQGAARVTVDTCERSSSLFLINLGP